MNNESRNQNFVQFIINRIKHNKGIAAALRRANNPDTEYQSWEQLAAFNIELDNDLQRLPFATIAAAIANANPSQNGNIGLGKALANCYENKSNSEQAKSKLRRLLSCDSIEEVCRILRPLFNLINSKGIRLDFSELLKQLLEFPYKNQVVKSRWAQSFYGHHNASGDIE